MTLFLDAAFNGDLDEVEFRVGQGMGLDGDGRTALSLAAHENNPDIVEFLLANGASLGIRDNDGRTPLDWAMPQNGGGGQEVTVILTAATEEQRVLEERQAAVGRVTKSAGGR